MSLQKRNEGYYPKIQVADFQQLYHVSCGQVHSDVLDKCV